VKSGPAASKGPLECGSKGTAIDTLETRRPIEAAKTAPGAIVLARHGEPALSRRVKLDSDGYRAWWARYEEGGLLEGQVPPEHLRAMAHGAHAVFASTRRRAVETARAVSGERLFVEDPMFIEAPLPPPRFPSFMKFSPRAWGTIARIWWWAFNHHQGEESFYQSRQRAARAAESLIEAAAGGRDVVVLAHGFFNHMVGVALKRRGWRCVHNEGFKYWSTRRYEKG
jgi:broad specificity phosphatase PhoE